MGSGRGASVREKNITTMTPMEGTEHHFRPFQDKDFGAVSGGPLSPGPFVLLLILKKLVS